MRKETHPTKDMYPVIVPASGCSLLFTGFSAMGFAFAAVALKPRTTTEDEAVVYYVFNGIGMLMALMAALPLQCCLTWGRLMNAAVCASLATCAFTVSTVFGVFENYKAHDESSGEDGGELYFFTWITAICSALVNGILAVLAIMALCCSNTDCEKEICAPPADVEVAPKRKTPRSRADLGK